MELRHLRYFVSVAEELHFRRAAQKLHIAQPALSKQISALEHELGVRLLDRDRRGVLLTEAGRVFLSEAVEVLARADGAVDRARAVVRGEVGRLAVGFIQPALADLLPRSLRAFRRHHPGVVLSLSEETSRTALEGITDRSLQLAFVRLPVAPRPELRTEVVSEEPVLLVVPRGHRLAERSSVRLEEVAGEEVILVGRSVEPGLHDYYVTACNRAGFSPRVAHEVSSTSIALGLVAGGLGIAFAPASARLAAQGTVAHVPLEDGDLTLTMGALWRAGPRPAVLDNFLALRPWEDGDRPPVS
ncbi:LysR family transcriptional regulator [Geodermatophilus sabuli]|uniref:Transcriptional regulator, LysR family n=1 Tax=Geodermatophilus sabuli TaxID=1564158 RepID=A0A285EDT8_9ACTN|nr:LysR substrate-binding domain-containing protein [Geodermatophilus sabuli]MBB3085326.1 DNA-binding transcriptional LysR family regulator [Geodermatophilus sabuli]SNX96246.1 transcriptional regulator, LysR family [Geodermatophilus sabuli]